MGFYIRKSVRVGPFRFNLSKSGIGVSTGVKGFRVGTGPRGNYIHIGRRGYYYRKTFPPSQLSPPARVRTEDHSLLPAFGAPQSHEPLQAIDSGHISDMVDSSSRDLVDELNKKRKKFRLWPLSFFLGLSTTGFLAYQGAPTWATYLSLGFMAILTLLAVYRDSMAKSAVVIYDVDEDCQPMYQSLYDAFDRMRQCRGRWHLQAQGRVLDKKYHAGADSLVKRSAISLTVKNPPYVKTNVATPSIPVGSQTLYFFPDKVLVFEPNGVGAVSYENLVLDVTLTRFIEEGSVPRDATVVGHTWKYVNKRGGPDKRFKDNRKLPIALYEDVHFSSNTGLNERIQLSREGVSAPFVETLQRVGQARGSG